jgi:hypothetical protein
MGFPDPRKRSSFNRLQSHGINTHGGKPPLSAKARFLLNHRMDTIYYLVACYHQSLTSPRSGFQDRVGQLTGTWMQLSRQLCFALAFVLIWSCSNSQKAVKKPLLLSHGLTLAKTVAIQNGIGEPKDAAEIFFSSDKEVLAFLRFDNLAEKHRIRWDWYAPDGSLYLSSSDFTVAPGTGKFYRTVTIWHALTIQGDKAASLPGQWRVDIIINEDLLDRRIFTVKQPD